MNKNGFTLVEIIAVIALLGLVMIIFMPNILDGGKNAKIKTLESKIKNIEKAAVLYGQESENKIKFTKKNIECSYCEKPFEDDGTCNGDINNGKCYIKNCYCFESVITVDDLAKTRTDAEGNTIEGYIKYDDGSNIINPYNDSKINDCTIQIYQKYGKIYAVYDKETNEGKCWYE